MKLEGPSETVNKKKIMCQFLRLQAIIIEASRVQGQQMIMKMQTGEMTRDGRRCYIKELCFIGCTEGF